MGVLDQIWERIRDLFTEEELNNLIIHEKLKEEERQRQERERPQIQIPLEPPPPPPSIYDEPTEDDEEERGVIVFDI